MKVQDVMTKDVQTCRAKTNLADAAMQMWRHDCGVLPVVTDGDIVVGMVTDRDICMAVATEHRDAANIRVGEVTPGKVYGCSPDVDIHEAHKIMREKQVRRLPISRVEDGKLLGILSLHDVALMEQNGAKAELSAEDVEQTMRAICAPRTLPLAKQAEQALAQASAS